MRVDEIRALSDHDLIERRDGLKEETMRFRFALATNQQTNHAQVRVLRRDIARINTILREREIAEELQQVLGEEQQVALRLKNIHPNADEIADWLSAHDHVVMGFKVFLDMQVAYARLMLPAELIRTTLGLTQDPSGPMFGRRLQSLRDRLPRVAHTRTWLTVEAGRSELSQEDLDGEDDDERTDGQPQRQSLLVTASSRSAKRSRAAARRVGTCSLGTPSAGGS